MKNLILFVFIAALTSVLSIWIYDSYLAAPQPVFIHQPAPNASVRSVNYNRSFKRSEMEMNFIHSAETALPTVVAIAAANSRPVSGEQSHESSMYGGGSIGSGVIIDKDGWIVTNYHVIADSKNIVVTTFDGQEYLATESDVRIDEQTDLALIKIDATNLPTIKYGSAENTNVGEWVLAIGNPYNLTSTVTAGIVSAKARDISVFESGPTGKSYIQTDAVINKGNSGGALINTQGQLIGINTFVIVAVEASSSTGYGFAIPVDIVEKVVKDLKVHKRVQWAVIGADVTDLTPELSRQYGLGKNAKGVLVEKVELGGAADKAGVVVGDVISELNGVLIVSTNEFEHLLSSFNPGDVVGLTFYHKNKKAFSHTMLTNIDQTIDVQEPQPDLIEYLGAGFEEIDPKQLERMGLLYGIEIVKITKGALRDNTAVRPGFIIIKVNKRPMRTLEEFYEYLGKLGTGDEILLEGIYLGDKHKTIYPLTLR